MKTCRIPCEASPFTMVTTTGYCDMTTDRGRWIVIQRNKVNSLVDFNKNWTDYELDLEISTQNFGMDWKQYIV